MTPLLHAWQYAEPSYAGSVPPHWAPVDDLSSRQPSLADSLDWFASPGLPTPFLSVDDSNVAQRDTSIPSQTQAKWSEAEGLIKLKSPLESAQSARVDRAAAAQSDAGAKRSVADEAGSKHPTGTGSRYTTERKLLKNREAQKRFRQRHKARSHDVEAQLAATSAELEELRTRQQQLEARNALLEKISYLSSKKSPGHALDEGQPDHGAYSAAQPFLQKLPAVNISLPGQQRTLSTQQATELSLQQFAALYTDFTCEIGACLLQLKDHDDPSTVARMKTLALEALNLTGRTMLKPANHRAIVNSRLDDAAPMSQKPGKVFYQSLLAVFDLSEAQIQDLMFLRRLNLVKRATLSAERKVLMQAMAASEAESLRNRSDNLSCLSRLATQLQQNTADDRQVYYKLARAIYRGVLTTRQIAEGMVHAYPYIAIVENTLDTLAELRGEPSKDQIAEMAPLNPMTAEWEEFIKYHAQFSTYTTVPSPFDDYIPVLARA